MGLWAKIPLAHLLLPYPAMMRVILAILLVFQTFLVQGCDFNQSMIDHLGKDGTYIGNKGDSVKSGLSFGIFDEPYGEVFRCWTYGSNIDWANNVMQVFGLDPVTEEWVFLVEDVGSVYVQFPVALFPQYEIFECRSYSAAEGSPNPQTSAPAVSCRPADVNQSGFVDSADVDLVTQSWNENAEGSIYDLTGDGSVNSEDLGYVLTCVGHGGFGIRQMGDE